MSARLLGNGEVCEEFYEDEHYIGIAINRHPQNFRVAEDCHEG